MRKLIGIFGLLMIAAIFVTGFFAYFVTSFDRASRTWSDGLGRQLTESPALVRWLHDQDQWVGLGWFVADMVIFFGGIGIGVVIAQWGFRSAGPADHPRVP